MKTTTKEKRNTIIMLLLSATIGIFSPLLMYITLARKNEVYKYYCRKAFNFHLLIFLLFNISSRISEYEHRYRGYVPFVLLVVDLFQYCRQNEMSFSHMLQYVKDKLVE
ncbi:TPA: hypothetical protein ACGXMH_002910 [Bacillus mobilis]|uniref:hypothetical protein n=1 Tax=Bacillus mobilis TaxID=2026190 RepID=UPI0011A5F4A3|nr:hypothetical protein [Bacillus mobilis]MED4384497.1 hypothetical protein [Bacillus mobilis]